MKKNKRTTGTKHFILLFVIFICIGNVTGQIVLSGKVLCENKQAVPYINVLVYPMNASHIIGFGISDNDGKFSIKLTHESDSLMVETRAIHYQKENFKIANRSQEITFNLKDDVKQLETFTVRASPIQRRGDTLSFAVGSFVGEKDRSIADVLKRMPGIEVETNGQILYHGLPIQKFYVEGLDLMDSRYSMVSNNLPHQTVSTVEVLENHQPIRILENKVVSHQASLNLKLKNKITTTGKARLGAGLSPILWEANITPMTFIDNFQFVASYQTNNIGNDVSTQVKGFSLPDLRLGSNRPDEHPGLLSIQSVTTPEFAPARFLNNNIHLFNINALTKLNNNIQLRTNMHYVNDMQKQHASAQHTLFTPNDTIVFNETINNRLFNNYLHAVFTLNRNVRSNFFENKLTFISNADSRKGQLQINETQSTQALKSPFIAFSNELRSIHPLGKKLIELDSYLLFDNSPHQLSIQPGVFSSIFNQGNAFDTLRQKTQLQRLYTENSAGLVYTYKRFVFTPRIGFALRQQFLDSHIEANGIQTESSFENALHIFNVRTFLQTEIQYRKKALTIRANLPFVYHFIKIQDNISNKGQNVSRPFFNPRLSVHYKFKGFWEVSGNWSYSNSLGNLDGVYYGFILRSYRNLSRNSAPLAITARNNFGFHIKHANAITSFFNSINFQHINSESNLLLRSTIQPNGASVMEAIAMPNRSQFISIQTNSSKYFSAIRSTFGLRLGVNQQTGITLLNNMQFNTRTVFYHFSPNILYRYKTWLNVDYNFNVQHFRSYIVHQNTLKSVIKQSVSLYAYPQSNQMLNVTIDYYKWQKKNDFFVDLVYRYTVKKHKVDVELKCMNLFDASTYSFYQVLGYSNIESTYQMNPRRLLVSIYFSF